MVPTPGGALADVVEKLSDPLRVIVARLAKGPTPNGDTSVVFADLVECDFPGYVPQPLVVDLDNALDEDGVGWLSPQTVTFLTGTLVAAQVATHLYVTESYNGDAAKLLMAVPFINPLIIRESDAEISFEVNVGGITNA